MDAAQRDKITLDVAREIYTGALVELHLHSENREEWTRRFRENNDWIETRFERHGGEVSAAVICCQANVVGQGKVTPAINALFAPFRVRFGKLASAFAKPVLFLHADGHVWTVDRPWKRVPNITRVQVDRLSPEFPPVQITVDPRREPPFRFERRLDDDSWRPPASGTD